MKPNAGQGGRITEIKVVTTHSQAPVRQTIVRQPPQHQAPRPYTFDPDAPSGSLGKHNPRKR